MISSVNWPARFAVLLVLMPGILSAAFTRAASPPVITLQPTNMVVAGGQTRFLSVSAEGDPQPAYQWYLNGKAIAGSTNYNHIIFGASTLQQGDYFAIASNAAGTATSDVVTVTVITNAPVILSQSSNLSVTAGQNVTIGVNATGLPPPLFAWFFNETNRLVSPTFSLAFRPAHATNSGIYAVVLSNSVSSVTSAPIVLNVSPFPLITTQPTNQTLNESDLLTMHVAALGAMPIHYQWFFEGTPLSGAMGTNFSVLSAYPTNSGRYYCVVSNSAGTATSEVAVITVTAAPMHPGALDVHYKPNTNGWSVSDLVLLEDDKLLAANTGTDAGLRRLNVDGTIDSSFASNRFSAEKIAPEPDGRILAFWGNQLARFDTAGLRDTTFAPAAIDLPNPIRDLGVQPDGGIVFVGYDSFAPLNYLGRLLPDGRLDRFFRTFEPIQVDGGVSQTSGDIKVLAVLPNGRLLFPAPTLQRRHPHGALDSSFSSMDSQLGSKITAIVPTRDQRGFYIMGTFTNIGSAVRKSIARLDDSGALDPTFVPPTNLPVGVTAAAVQLDGKVVVAGFFVAGSNAVIRLNVDGSVDETFTRALLGISASVNALAIQPDGKIIIGGTFIRVNGRRLHGLARLHGDPPSPPEILVQPEDTVATLGQQVSFHPTARAFGSVTYQWYRGNDLIAIEKAPTLRLRGIDLSDAGDYRLVVNTSYGAATSQVARLTIEPNPDMPGAIALDSAADIDGPVYAMEATGDDKYIIAGNFNRVNGVARPGLARITADGFLDTTFDPPETAPRDFYRYIRALAVTRDGRIYIGGGFTNAGGVNRQLIARLHSDGTLDESFDPGQVLQRGPGGDPQVYAIAVLPNSKVMAAGSFINTSNYLRHTVARFHPNGTVDTSFTSSVTGTARCLAVIDSNTVLIGGSLQAQSHSSTIYRVLGDGRADFTGGFVYEFAFGRAQSIKVLPDRKILVAGRFATRTSGTGMMVARLLPNGALDRDFNPVSITSSVSDDICSWIADAGCGKVLIGGPFRSVNGQAYRHVARLNADGTLDTTFNSGPFDGAVTTGLVLPGGDALVVGEFLTAKGVARAHLARINNGPYQPPRIATQPATHSVGEGMPTSFPPGIPCAFPPLTYQWQFDGINLVGETNAALSITDTRLFREGAYRLILSNSVGVLTSSVAQLTVIRAPREPGAPAMETSSILTSDSVVRCLYPLPDGKVLVGGSFSNLLGAPHRGLVRLNVDGSYDHTFNYVSNGQARAVAVLEGGKIMINEWAPTAYAGNSRLLRLHTNGALDTAFAALYWTEPSDGRRAIAIGADGRAHIVRNNFLIGFPGVPPVEISGTIHALLCQPDGKLLVGGAFGAVANLARTNLARLHTNGAVDQAFVPWAGTVYAMALQPDNKIVVGGQFTSAGGLVRRGVARFHSNGSVDQGFSPQPGIGGGSAIVNGVAVQADGKIIIGGSFTTYDGVPCNHLARLNADGSFDPTFQSGTGIGGATNPVVNAITLAEDGGVLVGGAFTTFNGVPRNSFARAYNNPKVLDFSRGSETTSFSFLSLLDRTYILEAKETSHDASWLPIQTVIGDGTIRSITYSNAMTEAVLYRLRVE